MHKIVKCTYACKGDAFTAGREYKLLDNDTMADDNGECHYAFVAITGACCANSFFHILRVGL